MESCCGRSPWPFASTHDECLAALDSGVLDALVPFLRRGSQPFYEAMVRSATTKRKMLTLLDQCEERARRFPDGSLLLLGMSTVWKALGCGCYFGCLRLSAVFVLITPPFPACRRDWPKHKGACAPLLC